MNSLNTLSTQCIFLYASLHIVAGVLEEEAGRVGARRACKPEKQKGL